VVDLTEPDDGPEPAPAAEVAVDLEDDELVAEAVATTAEPAASPSGNGAAVKRAGAEEREEVELVVDGPPLARRLAPLAGLLAAVLLVRWLVRRRRAS
jgi:hypothetical protein